MMVPQAERRITGTVTTERNRYGAMTLRSGDNETLQIVDCASPQLGRELDKLSVGDKVTVTVEEAPCRGKGWQVTAVEHQCDVDAPLVAN
ncbi:hypothetical protein EGH24_03990 [Halonotius terrestris]|uniref:DUF7999 domain-containing protein n=1 Tax=Halonotius terrestris TaxID=2487750 RepID=A0A8J8TD19_9EURY|nr:hypothetical protein [Halonotius terrestris]TQQ82621.1 hypothetical protein EGH24_03990 [Halonotius terrestris]